MVSYIKSRKDAQIVLFGLLLSLLYSPSSLALTDKFDISGSARFRGEVRDNSDFNSAVNDVTDFIGVRLRMDTKFTPTDYLEAFVQPQFTGVWGQVESNVSGAGTVTGGAFTSGALRDRELTLHQGYVIWHAGDNFDLKIGRQEIAFGEHVVIGDVGFSNVGRSFDAARGTYKFGDNSLDLFYSRLAEADFGGAAIVDDVDFTGVYSQFDTAETIDFLNEVDLYALWLIDDRAGTPINFSFVTLGVRLKNDFGLINGRAESNVQIGRSSGADMLAYMVDIEQGVDLDVQDGLRIAAGYNHASGDDPSSSKFTRYHALFSTAHKWLGYMDFFGRQNIQSALVKFTLKLDEQWKIAAHGHMFWRVRAADLLYTLAVERPIPGQTTPPTSASKRVGEEVNLMLFYNPHPNIALSLLGGLFFPEGYLETTVGGTMAMFSYLQAGFSF